MEDRSEWCRVKIDYLCTSVKFRTQSGDVVGDVPGLTAYWTLGVMMTDTTRSQRIEIDGRALVQAAQGMTTSDRCPSRLMYQMLL